MNPASLKSFALFFCNTLVLEMDIVKCKLGSLKCSGTVGAWSGADFAPWTRYQADDVHQAIGKGNHQRLPEEILTKNWPCLNRNQGRRNMPTL